LARFSEQEIERYARQMILPQVGGRGQEKLRRARVAVVGAGGLGSPVILYLAAAGVGVIDVIDDDVVDLGNLQRQVLHRESELGVPKVESARRAVAAINPAVQVAMHRTRLVAANALEVLGAADLVLDGSDNFPTRFLVNDACWFLRKPLVTGAILRFEGQVTVFPNDGGPDSPCYRCLFPEMPPPGSVPTCREAGILGPVAGVVGSLQATEALKLLLGIGEPLAGRLLIYDGLASEFRRIRLHRDPECALNGDTPAITGLVDMEQAACAGVPTETDDGCTER
jgi:adenylyltransferase/sulfurtransferase